MPNTPSHILLVEDDLFFAARILSVLDRLGLRTDTATTPETAIEKAVRDCPTLVILNLAAPRLGGLELIRRLKVEAAVPRLLAYLSHVKIPEVRAEVLAAGADKIVPNSAISLRLPHILDEMLSGQIGQAVEEDA